MQKDLFEGFHPGRTVVWESVKTRGDKVGNFHFLILELVTMKDAEWAQRAAGFM